MRVKPWWAAYKQRPLKKKTIKETITSCAPGALLSAAVQSQPNRNPIVIQSQSNRNPIVISKNCGFLTSALKKVRMCRLSLSP